MISYSTSSSKETDNVTIYEYMLAKSNKMKLLSNINLDYFVWHKFNLSVCETSLQVHLPRHGFNGHAYKESDELCSETCGCG
jgi:hypothetical protein